MKYASILSLCFIFNIQFLLAQSTVVGGLNSSKNPVLELSPAFPNPASGESTVTLITSVEKIYFLTLFDNYGRLLSKDQLHLGKGIHQIIIKMNSRGIHLFSIHDGQGHSNVVLINQQASRYSGFNSIHLKRSTEISEAVIQDYTTLEMDIGMPCPDLPSFTWEGQTYTTRRIGAQCWMAENLNSGTMINGNVEQEDNQVVEKYCYNNDPDYCNFFGGLYQWDEIMDYEFKPGKQGICPDGFHIPTDDEWKILEGEIDSEYGVGDPQWDLTGQRGTDVATRLKSTSGWINLSSGTNDYKLNILPVGIYHYLGYFTATRSNGRFWTSNIGVGNGAWYRSINSGYATVYRNNHGDRDSGFSLRCLKDEE